MTKPVNK